MRRQRLRRSLATVPGGIPETSVDTSPGRDQEAGPYGASTTGLHTRTLPRATLLIHRPYVLGYIDTFTCNLSLLLLTKVLRQG